MVNGTKTIYFHRLNKEFGLKFRVGSRFLHETPDEDRGAKHSEYKNKNKDSSQGTLKVKVIKFHLRYFDK